MLRQRLSYKDANNLYDYTPRKYNTKSENKVVLSEWKIATIALVFSLSIIAGKLYCANRDSIKNFVLEKHLVSYETIADDGQVLLKHAWTTAVRYSNFWLPALCGLLTTYFTWLMVFLDSSVPGVQPPSPFSPTKYKVQSGHSFHLNYIFAVLIGVFVFIYMYWKEVSIEFKN